MELMRLIPFFIQGSVSTTFFTSRPFLTVFGFALFARWGLSVMGGDVAASFTPAGLELLSYGNLSSTPWLLSDTILLVLGLLALLEFGAASNDDLRIWYNQSLWLVQPGSSFVVNYTFADTEIVLFLEFFASLLPATPVAVAALGGDMSSAGLSPAAQVGDVLVWIGHIATVVWAGLLATITWLLGRLRGAVVEIVEELDEDNTLGLQTLMHWTETGWTAIGIFILFILPTLALILAGLTIATLFFIRKYFEHRERRMYVPCTNCATSTHPSAPFCPACNLAREEVRQVGLFGQARDALVSEPTAHRLQLMARKRCPCCASRLREKAIQQACASCGTITFGDISEANSFIRALDTRLTRTTIITFVLGMIPLIGLVPAIIYYRLSLIASLRGYIPRSTGCFTRWGVRIINLCLIGLQPIPVLGALVLPLMCLVNYGVYRQVVKQGMTSTLGRTFPPIAAPTAPGQVAGAVSVLPQPQPFDQQPSAGGTCAACGTTWTGNPRFCGTCGNRLQEP
jgi:hypothetical protein